MLELDKNDPKLRYFRKCIIHWGRANYANFPWRHTTNKWHALVAEIMLQRTKADQVLPVWISFAEKYIDPCDYVEDKQASVFHGLGLYWREKYLKQLAKILCTQDIPKDKKSLLKLPGVGEYVASAYLSLHTGTREPIIDSNIVRLYGRFFGFETNNETRRTAWIMHLADTLTPTRYFKDYNYGLIDFTRTVCKIKPIHDICPIRKKCTYYLRKMY